MTTRDETLQAYGRFFETLTPASLPGLAAFATPDIRFKDPFNDVRGLQVMIRVLEMMYRHGTPRFEILDRAAGERAGYLLWRFTNDPGRGRKPLVVVGMSELRFSADGRICEHIDHWDSGSQFYEMIPVLGWLIRRIKYRLAVAPPPDPTK